MEFLASGTPTVMFKLECMPNEYDDYIFYAEGFDVVSLKNKIIEVCEMDNNKREQFGENAKKFILEKKNPRVQCGKIIDFINYL